MKRRRRILALIAVATVALSCAGEAKQHAYSVYPGDGCKGHEGVTALHRGHHYTCEGNPPTWTKKD